MSTETSDASFWLLANSVCAMSLYENRESSKDFSSSIVASMDEIEDNLYYFSDVISAGIPDVDRLITDNLLRLLILPLLLPSLIGAVSLEF